MQNFKIVKFDHSSKRCFCALSESGSNVIWVRWFDMQTSRELMEASLKKAS